MCDNRANVGQVCGDSIDLPSALREIEQLQDFRDRVARILGQSIGDCDDLLIIGLDSRIIFAKRQAARIKELEDQNQDLMANCNDLRQRCWEAEGKIGGGDKE